MATPLRALMVEDSEADCALLVRELQSDGFSVSHKRVETAANLKELLIVESWDIVISDYSMPGFSGTAALKIVQDLNLDIPFIFVSGTIGEEIAVEAMRNGAHDYVMKGKLKRLAPAIRREIQEAELRREHKRTELQLRHLEKFEVIGKLAGGIAHDFNNVLGAIQGWAELGMEESSSQTRPAALFQSIYFQALRAAGLTRQLLAYARRQVLEPRNIDLNQVLGETAGMLRRVIGENIEIKMALSNEPLVVRVDPAQIEQVIMNLCLNARDAMHLGGRLLIETSRLTFDEEYCRQHEYLNPGKHVRLSISDTGTGMDSETLKHIFEPFYTTKEVGKGTGLGLATTFAIVKQHLGAIETFSEPGRGTVFHVYLPASEAPAEPRQLPDNSAARRGTETILVAEDNEGVREVVEDVLRSLGYKLIIAKDGAEAISEFNLHSNSISLVLLDMVMPRASGPEVYDAIRKVSPQLPVILTSGYSENVDSVQIGATAMSAILQKPFSPKALGRKVRELLDAAQK
ncbi:MAG TPA: response regulator [Candidatus Acidoferrales bacterium]|nr:response regulator [Candidatus Acidoferrales bacterium]